MIPADQTAFFGGSSCHLSIVPAARQEEEEEKKSAEINCPGGTQYRISPPNPATIFALYILLFIPAECNNGQMKRDFAHSHSAQSVTSYTYIIYIGRRAPGAHCGHVSAHRGSFVIHPHLLAAAGRSECMSTLRFAIRYILAKSKYIFPFDMRLQTKAFNEKYPLVLHANRADIRHAL